MHKNNTFGKKPTYFCDHCKILGHSISRCFKLHGYPNRNKHPSNKKYAAAIQHDAYIDRTPNYAAVDGTPFGLTPDQYTNFLSCHEKNNHANSATSPQDSFANLAGPHSLISHISTTKWIIDNGSTDHICNNLSLFTNMHYISDAHHKITTPDGTQHKVTKKGTIEIFNGILLKNVLYVPEFKFNNLLSYISFVLIWVLLFFFSTKLLSLGSFNENIFASW